MQRRKWLQHMTYMADCEGEGIPLEKSAAMNTDITDQSSTCKQFENGTAIQCGDNHSCIFTALRYTHKCGTAMPIGFYGPDMPACQPCVDLGWASDEHTDTVASCHGS